MPSTTSSELALYGGAPAIAEEPPPYPSIGPDEEREVVAAVRSGCLSGFYGSHGEQFLGGPRVRAFEAAWRERLDVPFAVSVNSATSGLFAAMGACGVGPGDEVIVPPLTMSATVMAPLVYGALPVFVDVEPDTFCLDVEAVERAITPRTRVILAVNLFGHAARLSRLRALADARGLLLVEDNAQAPLARENGAWTGTVGHIGVFSLNYHKHIHTGEGGMCVTRDEDLWRRLTLIRNHGENVVAPMGIEDLTNLVGFNYRMTELSAAVGLAQLRAADRHVGRRVALAEGLSRAVEGLEGLQAPIVRAGCEHVYYAWMLKLDEARLGVSRRVFSAALAAEGFPHAEGYVDPLYRLPLFQRRVAFGRRGYPFNLGTVSYEDGMCPVAERLHERELLCFEPCAYDVDDATLARLAAALRKVHGQRGELARRGLPDAADGAPSAADTK